MIPDGEHNGAVAQEGELRDDSHRGKAGWLAIPSVVAILTLNPPLPRTATATATALSGDSFLPPHPSSPAT
jgi:hypothetical protein